MSPARRPDWHADLQALVGCHSTPGDEDEVARRLLACWQALGWSVSCHGRSAVSARRPGRRLRQPTLLLCAHMDSPGFAVQAVEGERSTVVPLGKPHFDGPSAEVVLKTHDDRVWAVLEKEQQEDGRASYWLPTVPGSRPGDRLCYHGAAALDEAGQITGPFLDNRLGCTVLCEMARRLAATRPGLNLVLGATACEEMGGFGAPVLAEAVQPDLVVCVDATYESIDHGVHLGGGPVLTLSDASVLLGCRERDQALAFAAAAGVAVQTEVYDRSGTDARAFPRVGLPARVYALLLPSGGNHTPCETAVARDLTALVDLLCSVCEPRAWRSFFVPTF